MDHLQCAKTGQTIKLHNEIANSGEGKIYQTNQGGFLAKIYHSCSQEKINKLKIMIENQPEDMTLAQDHISIAWPKDLVKDANGKYLGFLMPEIEDSHTLTNIYNPRKRRKITPGFSWYDLHLTALRLSSLIQSLHLSNYVIGDLKPENLLINKRAFVSIIDTDSFQVTDPYTGIIYLSPVASSEYTSAEIFGENVQTIGRSKVQDNFSLAIIIWLLLFGYHPFSGQWIGEGNQPSIDKLIHDGYWMYGESTYKIKPGKFSMPLEILDPSLQKLFQKCFDKGHSNPLNRPSTTDWIEALTRAINSLKKCSIDSGHYYSRSYGECYWCERKQELKGIDIFKSSNVGSGTLNISRKKIQPEPIPTTPVSTNIKKNYFYIKAIIIMVFISLASSVMEQRSTRDLPEETSEPYIKQETNKRVKSPPEPEIQKLPSKQKPYLRQETNKQVKSPPEPLGSKREQDLRHEMNKQVESLKLDKTVFYKQVNNEFYKQYPYLEGRELTGKSIHQTNRELWLEIANNILKNKSYTFNYNINEPEKKLEPLGSRWEQYLRRKMNRQVKSLKLDKEVFYKQVNDEFYKQYPNLDRFELTGKSIHQTNRELWLEIANNILKNQY